MARAALLRASFIARADLRSLRHIARHRQKLGGMLASEKNWLHKPLTDAGIRLGVVVSDLHGQSARVMLKALIAGKTVPEVLRPCSESSMKPLHDASKQNKAEKPAIKLVKACGDTAKHLHALEKVFLLSAL